MNADRAIGIGGSAGAIEAIRTILAGLPATLAAPVFIVMHVGPNGLNLLADIFGKETRLPVATAEDGEEPRPGHAYVAPADHHMVVVDGVIRLGRGPRENMSRPAIDPLFRSLGMAYGAGAIGVLLSGYLNDGAAGAADLKRCGGLTVVQNPADAAVASIPLAALQASDIDHRAPADDIAGLIMRLLAAEPPPQPALPPEVAIEVEIALGRQVDATVMGQIADPSAISCPACSGVLSQIRRSPLRFRCQIGHGYSGEVLKKEQDAVGLDGAVRVALRIVEERATLAGKLAEEARRNDRPRSAELYEERFRECRAYSDTMRRGLTGE